MKSVNIEVIFILIQREVNTIWVMLLLVTTKPHSNKHYGF